MTGLFIALVVLGLLIIGGGVIFARIRKNRKKEQEYTAPPEPQLQRAPAPVVNSPSIISLDHRKFERFMSEYDDGSMKFPELNYRRGARFTCGFGLAEGYKMINGKMVWGYVRMHSGTDRAGGGEYKGIKDIVMSPFDFNRSNIIDYGDKGYGTLIQLFNDEFDFEFRVAHMHPQTDIIRWSLGELKAGRPFKRNWFLGKAGTYGASSGNHTHTEILSQDERSEVLEILLEEKHGDKILKEYTTAQILNFYRKQPKFEKASDRQIIDDWTQIKQYKKVHFANKYMFRYTDWNGNVRTKYATNQLFNGL